MSEYGTYDELILENSRIRRENAEMLMRHGSIIAGITHAGLGIVDYLTHEQLIETLKQQREEAKLKSAMLEDFTKGIEEEGRTFNAPSARELDHLWKEIVLARKPDYGDWEYPAQACRHILAEIKEILTEQIKAWKVKDEPVPGKKLSDDPCKLYEEAP